MLVFIHLLVKGLLKLNIIWSEDGWITILAKDKVNQGCLTPKSYSISQFHTHLVLLCDIVGFCDTNMNTIDLNYSNSKDCILRVFGVR